VLYTAGGIEPSTSTESRIENLFSRTEDFSSLFEEIRMKLQNTSSTKEKKQLLTLVPESWTFGDIISFFGERHVNQRMIIEALKLKTEKGILAIADERAGRRLSDQDICTVQGFYLSDEYSRELPGMKSKVKTKEKDQNGQCIEKQKKLLLINIVTLSLQATTTNDQ
jgi:hypothetical protein